MNEPHVTINHAAEASAVADEVRKSIEPRVQLLTDPEGQNREFLFLPSEVRVESVKAMLEEYRTRPERRRGVAVLTELDSFIGHVNRFKDGDSAIFADRSPSQPSLLAVLDYHRAGAEGAPRFGGHRAKYAFPLSEEWIAWTSQNGKPMGQGEFAKWIEDRLPDVADPSLPGAGATKFAALLDCKFASASKLLELSRGLAVHVDQSVAGHVTLGSGESSFTFSEVHNDKGGAPLKIPGAFLLAIPVFRGGAPYEIPTRLRYRVKGGQVSWFYDMHRASAVFDHVVDEACERAIKETSLPLFAGSPEA